MEKGVISMKIQYLGTAAYEGIPALFCQCEWCKKAKELGGKNIHSRSQALINDDLLIDFPPDTWLHYVRFGFDWTKIENCLITHSHSDHFYLEDMEQGRRGVFSHGCFVKLQYYADQSAYIQMKERFERSKMSENAQANLIPLGKIFKVGKYEVMAVRANHDPASTPVVYAISDGAKKMLYCNDTGLLAKESLDQLQTFGKFDLISLDCTGQLEKGWEIGHMSLDTNVKFVKELEKRGMVDANTIKVVNHFSHNGKATYEELAKEAESHGMIVSYDGLEIEF